MSKVEELKLIKNKPVVVANKEGIIVYVNSMFEVVFGWTFKEIVGKTITSIIPNSFHDAHHLGFSRFQSTHQSTILDHPLKLQAVRKDGSIFSAEHIIVAESLSNDWLFAATIEPIEG